MKKVLLVSLIIFLQSACVNFEINPGDVVADSVDAGKQLYQTIRRKLNGEEERKYSNYLASTNESEDLLNIQQCRKNIEANIAASDMKLSKVMSESSEIVEVDGIRKAKCEMVVLVSKK